MRPVRTSVDLARAPAAVFEYLADFSNNPRWQRGIRSARWTSPPPHGAGSTYDQVAHFLGRDIVSSFEVVDYQAGQRVKIASTAGPFPIRETRIVESGPTGTRVTAIVEGDASRFFRLAGPLLRPLASRSVRSDYRRLKRHLEAANSPYRSSD